ncbi:MAG: permease [Collinsella sp.]
MGIGAFIHNWIPAEWIELVLGDGNPFAVVLAHPVGAPIYADTFGAIPIAEALYYKGTGLGTVLAFMMSVTTVHPQPDHALRVIKPKLMVTFVELCIVGMCISATCSTSCSRCSNRRDRTVQGVERRNCHGIVRIRKEEGEKAAVPCA